MKRFLLNLIWIIPMTLIMQSFNSYHPVEKDGYRIEMDIKGFQEPFLILAHHYADKQYIQDTVFINRGGKYVFEGKEKLKGGMYMIVMPPKNNSIDILIDTKEQHFSFKADLSDLVGKMEFKGSKTNSLFYKYLGYLNDQRSKSNKLSTDLKTAQTAKDQAKVAAIKKQLTDLSKKVTQYQKDLVKNNPDNFTAKFIKTSMDIVIPKEIDSTKQYAYYRAHYFDNLDLSDGRLMRTPLLHNKVDRYLDKVISQHPDSVIHGVDEIFSRASKDEDIMKFFLIRLINKYAKTKIVCMDAVYVHIADNYYLKGKAAWVDEKQLAKIKEDADRLRPLLCNQIAPDLTMQTLPTKDGEKPKKATLHGVDAKYTVLIFWASDCGHCKKSLPKVAKFYDEYKNKGVEVFSICTKTYKDYQSCLDFVKEKDLGRMMNVADPYLRSKFPVIYDIKSTPVIFLLDKNKKIIAKKLAAEQLGEVIDNWDKQYEFLKKKENEKKNKKKSGK